MCSQSGKDLQTIQYQQAVESILHRELLDRSELPVDVRYYYSNLNFSKTAFEQWRDKIREKKLRGEIATAIINPEHQILLHTKHFYPDDAYRIPTGGIETGESADQALPRELYEETGFHILKHSLKAVILYEFCYQRERLGFVTFLYHVLPNKWRPIVYDESEQITDFIWTPLDSLNRVIDTLVSLPTSGWRDWGRMRAKSHQIILQLDAENDFRFK